MRRLRVEHVAIGEADALEHTETMHRVHDLRRRVFVEEQRVDAALEWDGLDPLAEHFLARETPEGTALGTARMRILAGRARAERVAVLPSAREAGIGRLLMTAIESRARLLGCREIVLHAQVAVLGFYERLGYRPIAITPEYYGNREAAVRMAKDLWELAESPTEGGH